MARMRSVVRAALHEPITAFLLLGVAIFGVDRIVNGAVGAGDDAAAHIVVTASQQAALRDAIRAEQGREPRADEVQARLDRWIDEQVLYREALALGLDRRDLIVHRQLTQKMRLLLDSAQPLTDPSEADLQAWLDQHPERYGHGPALSFEHVFLSRGRHGSALPNEARRIGARLAQAPQQFVGLGDAFLTGQIVVDAENTQLRRDFGPDFAESLAKLPQGQWSGPVASSFGLHLVRITRRAAFRPGVLSAVAERVRRDYQTAQREVLIKQALERLRAQYRIEIVGASG